MIRTIIVDDEENNIDALQILLAELRNDVQVLGTAGNASDAVRLIELHQPNVDLLLLDIQMPQGDGFLVLQKLAVVDFKVIFVTAYDKFALKAIKFSALDYILKPVDPYELNEVLNLFNKSRGGEQAKVPREAQREFKQNLITRRFFDKLAIPTTTDIIFVPISDIACLKSDNNYTAIITGSKKQITSSKNLGHYEGILSDHGFFRVHNSSIVNISKITRFIKGKTGAVELDNGLTVEVTASRKDELLQLLSL